MEAEENHMEDNIGLYLKVKRAFNNQFLGTLEEREMSNEWNYYEHKTEGSYSYYKMILDCECHDGGFIQEDVHDYLCNVLRNHFFLLSDEYLDDLYEHRTDKGYRDTLERSYDCILEASKKMKEAFEY